MNKWKKHDIRLKKGVPHSHKHHKSIFWKYGSKDPKYPHQWFPFSFNSLIINIVRIQMKNPPNADNFHGSAVKFRTSNSDDFTLFVSPSVRFSGRCFWINKGILDPYRPFFAQARIRVVHREILFIKLGENYIDILLLIEIFVKYCAWENEPHKRKSIWYFHGCARYYKRICWKWGCA